MTPDAYPTESITLAKLIDCPLNARTVDPAAPDIIELGASLAHRQEVDLIVRPTADGQFEVLDGKRRLAAARTRDDVPALWCQVRAGCTDAEALQIIIVTQLHRLDLDPLAEAGLVRQLLDGGMTQAACAAELGRSVAWVAKRARLMDLAAPWRERRPAWATVAHLEVVARMPEAVQCAIAKDYAEAWCAPHSVADFAEEISAQYLHTLKQAPWKLDDLAVLPTARACTDCPQRSSCQQSLFDDQAGADDRCLDAGCWSAKLAAHTAGKARALAGKHQHILIVCERNGQPAPQRLPDNAVVAANACGLIECRKSDAGAVPAVHVETGKQNWVRIEKWADEDVRAALGLTATPPATRKASSGGGAAPTAQQKREAKRVAMRLRGVSEALVDADPPDLMTVVRLYAVFCEAAESVLDPVAWGDVASKSEADIRALLWDAVARRASYEGTVCIGALPAETAVEALERLATLDPEEQRAKALAEIPEPKGRG
jgi:ParB/RepB/Spo0J family partition protein